MVTCFPLVLLVVGAVAAQAAGGPASASGAALMVRVAVVAVAAEAVGRARWRALVDVDPSAALGAVAAVEAAGQPVQRAVPL